MKFLMILRLNGKEIFAGKEGEGAGVWRQFFYPGARVQAHAHSRPPARAREPVYTVRFTPDAIMAVTLFGDAAPRTLGKFDRAVVRAHTPLQKIRILKRLGAV
jgi:hypothetical protein